MDGFTRDLSVLERQVCWVIFRFPDSSVKMLRTTLRADLLDGIDQPENSLLDLDTQLWFNLDRVDGSNIEIYTSEPEMKEVELFANQYLR